MIRSVMIVCLVVWSTEIYGQDNPVRSTGAGGSWSAPAELNFKGYSEAPKFVVAPPKDKTNYYPCDQCHQFMEPNPKVRELNSPHPIQLEHGAGRVWCLNCHHATERNFLRTHLDEKVRLEDAYFVCGGCHADRQKDWYFGAHGRRVDNWLGERELLNCTHCHDPHQPALQPRKPLSPPPVRAGLQRPTLDGHAHLPVWDRNAADWHEDASDDH